VASRAHQEAEAEAEAEVAPGRADVAASRAPQQELSDGLNDFSAMTEVQVLGQGGFGVVTLVEDSQT
jgi:hypothetical protein